MRDNPDELIEQGEVDASMDELDWEASQELERVEEEARNEAEAFVEAADGSGDTHAAVDAAGTAFDFDEAKRETERIAEKR